MLQDRKKNKKNEHVRRLPPLPLPPSTPSSSPRPPLPSRREPRRPSQSRSSPGPCAGRPVASGARRASSRSGRKERCCCRCCCCCSSTSSAKGVRAASAQGLTHFLLAAFFVPLAARTRHILRGEHRSHLSVFFFFGRRKRYRVPRSSSFFF